MKSGGELASGMPTKEAEIKFELKGTISEVETYCSDGHQAVELYWVKLLPSSNFAKRFSSIRRPGHNLILCLRLFNACAKESAGNVFY